jgi:uncharacterized protein (TIGR03437 family)
MLKYCAFLSLCACAAMGQDYITGQGARLVIGQTTFTSQNYGNSNTVFGAAGGLAASPPSAANQSNGWLFLADANRIGELPVNNRVLMFPLNSFPQPTDELVDTTACPACVGQATLVLGQTDIQGDVSGLTSQNMNLPLGVCTDGNVIGVADTANNRVLLWLEMPAFIGQPADVVLGQPNFTTVTEPVLVNASSVRAPQGCWIQSGKLYVADTQNNRILIWNTIPTKNNQAADVVLGQPNFTTVPQYDQTQLPLGVVSAQSMLSPTGVSSDGTHLFVADLGFDRVLIWNSLPTANDQPADVEIGQQDMTNSVANDNTDLCASNGVDSNGNPTYPPICGSTLSFPRFVIPDQYGRLYVADGGNDRVLVYKSIPTFNAASADIVLGEPDQYSDVVTSTNSEFTPDLTISGSNVTPCPTSLAWDGENLYVADPTDFRVLVFTPETPNVATTGVVNSASRAIYAYGRVTISGTLTAGDELTITIGSPSTTAEGGGTTANSTTNAYTYTVTAGDVASGSAYQVGSLDAYDTVITNIASLINTANNGNGDPNVTASVEIGYGIVQLTSRVSGIDGNTISLTTSVSTGATEKLTTSGGTLSGGGDATTLAPGTIISVMGTNLSDNTATADPTAAQLPTQLGGVEVYVDGIRSPLMYVSPTEINLQIPWETVDTNSSSVVVRTAHNDGSVTVTDAIGIPLATQNPGLYAQITDANGNPLPDPRPAMAYHGSSYATDIVSVDGTIAGGDVATIQIQDRIYNYNVQATDTLASVEDSLIAIINANPQEVVTASPAAAYTRIVLQAKVPGPEGDGIPINATQTTTAASGAPAIVLTAIDPNLCCANVAGSPITQDNPAVAGEFIWLYATGLGLVTPDVAKAAQNDGEVYNGPVLNTPASPVSSLVGGNTATLVSAGLQPGTVGIYKVVLQLSSGLASNLTAEVTIAQDIYTSNVVTIPVYNSNSASPAPVPAIRSSPAVRK